MHSARQSNEKVKNKIGRCFRSKGKRYMRCMFKIDFLEMDWSSVSFSDVLQGGVLLQPRLRKTIIPFR
jgi:hypothetical protein